ncbi:hypothetical protein [Myxosarcina sp. GI1(2024)]
MAGNLSFITGLFGFFAMKIEKILLEDYQMIIRFDELSHPESDDRIFLEDLIENCGFLENASIDSINKIVQISSVDTYSLYLFLNIIQRYL